MFLPPFLTTPRTWGALALVFTLGSQPAEGRTMPQAAAPAQAESTEHESWKVQLPPGRPLSAYPSAMKSFGEALDDTQASFTAWGFQLPNMAYASRLELHENQADLRAAIAKSQGTNSVRIPESTAAMVSAGTFFFMEEEAYQRLCAAQNPGKPAQLQAHHQLLVRELTHRAQALVAKQLHGNEGAVGPDWFTEGLAYAVAEAHDPTRLMVGSEEARAWWAQEKAGRPLSGPQRGALVRHLLTWKSAKACFTEATQSDFPK